ncbi:MAG: hypothetical protein V4736_12070 [Bdellovibrionota bacterium]
MRLLILFSLLFTQTAFACPKKADEKTLTIARAMYNFRDYLSDADRLLTNGLMPNPSITDAQLVAGAKNVAVALSCADALLQKNIPELTPEKVSELEGVAKEEYLKEYYDYLERFKVALTEYHNLYNTLSTTPAAQRDYRTAVNKSMEVRDLANEAHHHL